MQKAKDNVSAGRDGSADGDGTVLMSPENKAWLDEFISENKDALRLLSE